VLVFEPTRGSPPIQQWHQLAKQVLHVPIRSRRRQQIAEQDGQTQLTVPDQWHDKVRRQSCHRHQPPYPVVKPWDLDGLHTPFLVQAIYTHHQNTLWRLTYDSWLIILYRASKTYMNNRSMPTVKYEKLSWETAVTLLSLLLLLAFSRTQEINATKEKQNKVTWICIVLYQDASLKRSDMARVLQGVTRWSHSFTCHPHKKPYLPLLPNRKASPPFIWCSLRLPTKGWPGWVDLSGWLHTEINVSHRELNDPDTVTHASTKRTRRRLTSLIETTLYTTTPEQDCVLI